MRISKSRPCTLALAPALLIALTLPAGSARAGDACAALGLGNQGARSKRP